MNDISNETLDHLHVRCGAVLRGRLNKEGQRFPEISVKFSALDFTDAQSRRKVMQYIFGHVAPALRREG